ncbi:MAG: hypothetical protein K8T26_05835 [Lentisphaerae bacterium]|nr:hypothetical protein [Lentisphaerota bacterium]
MRSSGQAGFGVSAPSARRFLIPYSVWIRLPVFAGWFTVALCGLLQLPEAITFQWHSDSGIVGWVAANRYPKQQELFYFAVTVIGFPAVMAGGWLLFLLTTSGLSRLCHRPKTTLSRPVAALHLLLLRPWPRLLDLDPSAWKTLISPLWFGIVPLLGGLTAWCLFRGKRLGDHPKSAAGVDNADQVAGNLPPTETLKPIRTEALQPARPWYRHPTVGAIWRISTAVTVYGVIPALLYALAYRDIRDGPLDLFHDGEAMVPMSEIRHGAIPYRDIYIQHGLLYDAWIPSLGAKLFGPTLAGVRAIQGYVAPTELVAIYFLVLASFRFRLVAALVVAAVPLALEANGRRSLGFLSIAVLASAIASPQGFELLNARCSGSVGALQGGRARLLLLFRKGWRLMLAGALATLACWHTLEGLYALATGILFTTVAGLFHGRSVEFRRRPLPLVCYSSGAFLGFWIIGWYFLLHGALGDVLRNSWVQCAYQTEIWGLPAPRVLDILRPMLAGTQRPDFSSWLVSNGVCFYAGAFALVAAATVLTFRAFGKGFWYSPWAPQLLLLTFFGASCYRSVLGRCDEPHADYSVLLFMILGFFMVAALAGKAGDIFLCPQRLTARIAGGTVVAILAIGSGIAMGWYMQILWQPIATLTQRWEELRDPPPTTADREPLPGVGVLDIGGQEAEMEPVVDYIRERTEPGDRVFDFTNQALLIFLADRRLASRYVLPIYASLPSMQREIIEDLERHSVNLVIYSSGDTWREWIDGIPQYDRLPLLAAYLDRTFKPATTVGPVTFWQRIPVESPASSAADNSGKDHPPHSFR